MSRITPADADILRKKRKATVMSIREHYAVCEHKDKQIKKLQEQVEKAHSCWSDVVDEKAKVTNDKRQLEIGQEKTTRRLRETIEVLQSQLDRERRIVNQIVGHKE